MTTKIKVDHYYYGLGRRKTASARVRLYAGSGKIVVNEKPVTSPVIEAPLALVAQKDRWDISAKAVGGGFASQQEAVRLGVARALLEINPEFRKSLRLAGFLTRDPRAKERKKPGLKRARKAPQWSKR